MDFSIVGKQKGAEFYINYEECKCWIRWHFRYRDNGFILTMRNVNNNEIVVSDTGIRVLY